MSEEREPEIVSKSYRRRIRLMKRMLAPFEVLNALDLLLIVWSVIGAIVLALKAW